MAAHALIVIDGIKLYRHDRGHPYHPSYMVSYLLQQMRVKFMDIDAEEMATGMVRYGGFSCAQCEHGDEKFLYRVNTKRKDIFVYQRKGDAWKLFHRAKA